MPITIRVSKRKLRAWKMLLTGAAILAGALLLGGRVRPAITSVFTYQAQLAATRSVNDAVLDVIGRGGVDYQSIIHVREDAQGRVTFLETDMTAVNRLKAEITNAVSDRLNLDAQSGVQIPIGTLLGGQFLSGRGPDLTFRVISQGYAKTDFYNAFQEAGINQTLHQIMLRVEVPVSAVMPTYTVDTVVSTEVCVAETVIVGDVPQSFTEISGDHRGLLDKAGDYALKSSGLPEENVIQ